MTFVVSPLFYHILIALSKEYFFTLAIRLYLRQVIHKTAILQVVFCCLVKCFWLVYSLYLGKHPSQAVDKDKTEMGFNWQK